MPILNSPVSGEDLVIRDLVDETRRIVVPGAVYRRSVSYTLIGINSTLTTATVASMHLGSARHDWLHPDYQSIDSWAVRYADAPAALVRFQGLNINAGFSVMVPSTGGNTIMQVPNFNGTAIQKTNMWWASPLTLWMLLTPESTSLFATLPVFNGCLHKLPLPNIYEHGAICMGREFRCEHGDKPWLDIERRLKHLMDSQWNADLAPREANTRAVFMWDGADKQIEVSEETVARNCSAIMNNEVSQLILGVTANA